MMQPRPGERITDEARFVASHQAYSATLKGKAREAYQHNLDTYYNLKNKQKS